MRFSCVSHSDSRAKGAVPEELRELAVAVRRIGSGYRHNPETIALAKEAISERLVAIAREMEARR